MLVRPVMNRLFFPWKTKETKARFARAPHYKSFHISTTPTTRGRKRRSPGSIPLRRVWKPQPNWMIADWMRLMEPARGERCPSSQRRGLAVPREDEFPSPGQKSFHMSTPPKTRGRKRRSPGSIPPRRVRRPHPHWVIADWLGLMEPEGGESFPSGQRRGSAAHGEDKFPSPDHKFCHVTTTQANRDENGDPRVDTAPQDV